MKRLVAVLSGLLVLPAFAEVAPIVYDEIVEYSDEEIVADDAVIVDEVAAEKVVAPVVQPSKTGSRNVTASSRAASRAVPSGTTANSRSISARNTSSSRNATQARTGTAMAGRTNTTATRVASRPTRGTATATNSGVTSRSATTTSKGVAARAGSLVQTDTVNKPLYTGRVSVRSSSAMQARSPSTAAISVTQDVSTTSTDISDLDQLAQMTDYCKAQYMACMDNFCNVLDDNQGRCSCSKNLKNYEKTELALKNATNALQEVAQQIQYIGLSSDQIKTLFSQTEAEQEMGLTKDNTTMKTWLDKIADGLVEIKTSSATSSETGLNTDISGLFTGFTIDSTGFDITTFFNGTTSTNSISNQRGEQLYKTATARCKTSVLNTCQAQGVDISVITNSYDLEIDKQCIVYERSLNEANDNMNATVRNAKAVLQKARLMVAQKKNSYDMRGCINALDTCMQDEFVCGSDYEGCLDPTGKYIVNGKIVEGSTPGKANESANGLYSVWNYAEDKNAWDNGSLTDYISTSLYSKTSEINTNATQNLAQYLQAKIGYHDDKTGKNVGMCISVLNQCQDYTYDKDGNYKPNNQVVSEYLQRTLVQIKSAQDEMLADYAENCLSDVASCLQQNNSSSYYYGSYSNSSYEDISNVAINACKAQIKTCMSTMGTDITGATSTAVTNEMKAWLESAFSATTNPTTKINFVLNDCAAGLKEVPGYVMDGYAYDLPTKSKIVPLSGDSYDDSICWCWKTDADTATCKYVQSAGQVKKDDIKNFIENGATLYLYNLGQTDCTAKTKL